jgi:hypothetical protein
MNRYEIKVYDRTGFMCVKYYMHGESAEQVRSQIRTNFNTFALVRVV